MPKTKRDYLKRTTAQAYHNIDRALLCLKELHETFKPYHPKHAELLALISNILIKAQEFILEFWTLSWGKPPDNIEAWRK